MRRSNFSLSAHAGAVLLFFSAGVWQATAQKLPTPAEQKIATARKSIEAKPQHYQSYNDLALALSRRARETSDTSYYIQAEEALEKSFTYAPNNLEGKKIQIWILLGKHEFAKALERAQAFNKQVPDDLLGYAFLTDANIELGNYEEAEKAAQWLLDIRPGNVPGLTRAAYLRELFGDIEGAVELMGTAYERTQPTEVEDRAWLLTQTAHLRLMEAKTDEAEKLLLKALELFPRYHYSLANLAKVRAAQGRHAEAVSLLRERYNSAPHPENLYELAEALQRAGRFPEARLAYAEFEQKARSEMQGADNSNRELIFYYANRARKPSEALRIAQLEISRRHDVYTLDAYAWALFVNRSYREAQTQIEKALAVGIRDANIFYHAGSIYSKLNNHRTAARYLKQSLDLNPSSEWSPAIRKGLAKVQG